MYYFWQVLVKYGASRGLADFQGMKARKVKDQMHLDKLDRELLSGGLSSQDLTVLN